MTDLTHALVYHDVVPAETRDTAGFPGPVAGVYKLDPEQFEAHLERIAAAGLRPGLVDGGGRTMLTFDDGGASAPWIAAALERHGWRGAFFVVSGRIGTPGFLTAAQVQELDARGHELGSHTHTHPAYMGRLGSRRVAEEWIRSRDVLTELLGTAPRSAAVPGGSVAHDVVALAAQAGYERLFTSTPSPRANRYARMTVIGRYTIWASDRPELVAALARGDRGPCVRRRLSWEVKSAAKRVSPRAYEALRAGRARRASAAARNDANRLI